MQGQSKIVDNIRKGKLITSITNLIAAFIFFMVYLSMKNILILILAIILAATSIIIYFYFSKLERKYDINEDNKDEIK
ncbi:hypothetical protein ACFLSQ_07870 [Bacteroidota bacterium]